MRTDKASNNRIATYRYDTDNRRTEKLIGPLTAPTKTTLFSYDGWRVCQDSSGTSVTEATYVYNPVYLDEPVQFERTASHPLGAGGYYLHQNARADVVTLTNAAGGVVETYRYDDYGNPETVSSLGNPYGFQGRRHDPETGLYYFRNRMYDAATGRFLQRDPVWDKGNFGGWYTFAGNGPVSGRDALGTQAQDPLVREIDVELAEVQKNQPWWDVGFGAHAQRIRRLESARAEALKGAKAARAASLALARHRQWVSANQIAGSNFVAGWGDTLSIGASKWTRSQMGINHMVDPCSRAYAAGEWTGIGHALMMGGGVAVRGALRMGGQSGSLLTRLRRGAGRFFRDSRKHGTVRDQYGEGSRVAGTCTTGSHLSGSEALVQGGT